MLIYDHFYLNILFKNYDIKNIILKNNFEIKKYQAKYKIKNFQFIILSRYILLETTIILVSQNYTNTKFFLNKQLCNYITPKLR